MNARITLVGMNNEVKAATGHEINSTWGVTSDSYDNDVMLETIIRKGGRFEPLYTDPIYFDAQCAMFWRKWYRTFDKWFTVFDKEYEPLWDRNGYEEVHEDTTDTGTNDTTSNSTEVMDDDTTFNSKEVMDDDTTANSTEVIADKTTFSSTEVMDDDTTGHTENKVSAFDSSTYSPHDESNTQGTDNRTTTTNSSGTDDRTTTTTSTGTDDRTTTTTSTGTDDRTTTINGSVDNDTTNDRDFDRTYHSWGNWGISQTSQKLLEQELKVQAWNIYDHIADIFCKELLITVF